MLNNIFVFEITWCFIQVYREKSAIFRDNVLGLLYIDLIKYTHIWSWTITNVMVRKKKSGLFAVPRTVPIKRVSYSCIAQVCSWNVGQRKPCAGQLSGANSMDGKLVKNWTAWRYSIKMLVQVLKWNKLQIHPLFDMYLVINKCFWWLNSLMRRSAATWLLGSRIRIPPRACMFVPCVVCLNNDEAYARFGLQRHK